MTLSAAFGSWEFYVVAPVAVILLGLSKGGFTGVGLLALPLMALVVPPLPAAAVLLPIIVVQNGISAWLYRRHIDWRNIYILLPGAMLGTVAGYLLATWFPPGVIDLGVGLVSAVFGVTRLWPRRIVSAPRVRRAPVIMGTLVGTLAGFINLIANAGGPPVLMYLLGQGVGRDVLVGTSVFFFTVLNLVRVIPYLALGWLTSDTIVMALLLMPLAILATWWGVWLVRRTPGQIFFQIAYALLAAVGIKLMWDGIHSVGVL